ncbi:MAG: rhodanese-like domain-containing protein [Acidobacteriia bacterium]|nr:rhodanese-like domain-containing protein [Terriglobia bacterium]
MKPVAAILVAVGALAAQQPDGAAINPPWSSAEVIHAADLAKMVGKNQPRVFQVGFAQLYKSKHVPGSIYAGPALSDEGLAALKKAVANVPKDAQIVLYCGCCPWDHCPNMKPAYKLLHGLGYSKIKIVEIPNNFATDWVEKGYPVEGNTASSHGN